MKWSTCVRKHMGKCMVVLLSLQSDKLKYVSEKNCILGKFITKTKQK